MIFAEKLVVLRKREGLSQEELAEKLGVTRQAVHKWETEQSMPNIETLKVLSRFFEVSLDRLLDDKEDMSFKQSESKRTHKQELGFVYISTEHVENIDVEGDNTRLTEEEKKQQKEKDNRVRFTFRSGIICIIAVFVIVLIQVVFSKVVFSITFPPIAESLLGWVVIVGIVFLIVSGISLVGTWSTIIKP